MAARLSKQPTRLASAILATAVIAACGSQGGPAPPVGNKIGQSPRPGTPTSGPFQPTFTPGVSSDGTAVVDALLGRWRSPERILVGTGRYLFLDIDFYSGSDFAGSWAAYVCRSGDCSLAGSTTFEPAEGDLAADGTGFIELVTAGSSRVTWEFPTTDRKVARMNLLDPLLSGSGTYRSLVCRPEATSCRIPEPTRPPVAAPAGFPLDLPIPPGGRKIGASESNQPTVYPIRLVVEVPGASFNDVLKFFVDELTARTEWRTSAVDRRDPTSRTANEPDPYVLFKADSGDWFADIVVKPDSARVGGPVVTATYDVCLPRCPGQ